MPTVHREGEFAFRTYLNDHGPPHVHVYTAGASAVIAIDGERPRLETNYGMKKQAARRAVEIATAQHSKLLEEWRRIHGQSSRG